MRYLGDFKRGQTLTFLWSTYAATGSSSTPTTAGTVTVYKDGDATESGVNIVDTRSFDGKTGIHLCSCVLNAAFHTPGSDYTVVLLGAVIDGQTVNATLATFSLENRDRMVVSVGTLTAGAGTSATLPVGQRANVRPGDALRVVGKGFKIIDAYNATTGVATFRSSTSPDLAASDPYEVVALPSAEPISAADIATGAIDADAIAADAVAEIQSGLATVSAIFAKTFPASELGFTFEQLLRVMAASLAGKMSGLNLNAPVARNLADTGNVIVAASDASGNRLAVTLTP